MHKLRWLKGFFILEPDRNTFLQQCSLDLVMILVSPNYIMSLNVMIICSKLKNSLATFNQIADCHLGSECQIVKQFCFLTKNRVFWDHYYHKKFQSCLLGSIVYSNSKLFINVFFWVLRYFIFILAFIIVENFEICWVIRRERAFRLLSALYICS